MEALEKPKGPQRAKVLLVGHYAKSFLLTTRNLTCWGAECHSTMSYQEAYSLLKKKPSMS